MRWSFAGPIRGMRCTRIYEPADPHTWKDNYLCVPRRSPLRLKWSFAGRVRGMACIQWREPADPHTWHDNFLCGKWKHENMIKALHELSCSTNDVNVLYFTILLLCLSNHSLIKIQNC
jgi:hypothetical protein